MTQRNLLSESNQIQPLEFYPTFATSSEICSQQVSGLSLEKREHFETMSQKKQNFKRAYDQMAHEARQQMALLNRCRMHKQGGKGVVRSATSGDACLSKNLPFYTRFLNR